MHPLIAHVKQTPEFIAADTWLPKCSSLNSVDYRIWRVIQERVYHTPIQDVAELWRRWMSTWTDFQQSVLDEAVDSFIHSFIH